MAQVGLAYVYQIISEVALAKDLALFFKVAIFVFFYLIFEAFMDYLPRKKRAIVVQNVMMSMRSDLNKKIKRTPLSQMINNDKSEFTSILVNDLKVVEDEYLNPLLSIIFTFIVFIFSLMAALQLQSSFALTMVIISIIPLFSPWIAKNILSSKKSDMVKEQKNYLTNFEEYTTKFKTLKLANSVQYMNKKLVNKNQHLKDSKVNFLSAQGKTYAISYGLGNVVYTGTWIIGAWFIINDQLTFPQLIAMTQLMSTIAGPIQFFSDSYTELSASQKVVNNILNTLEEKAGTTHEQLMMPDNFNSITFNNVSFQIAERMIVETFNFKFLNGKKYAIVGESGSGKSTLVNLLARIYKPTAGEIKIDEINVKAIDLESFYSKISFISQTTDIFNDTIAKNVSMLKHEDTALVIKALENAGLKEWLKSTPKGSRTLLGEGENVFNLSGGERRRLDFARSIYQQSQILIFDEPTTGLDAKNEKIVSEFIKQLDNHLVIVVTHSTNQEFLDIFDEIIQIQR